MLVPIIWNVDILIPIKIMLNVRSFRILNLLSSIFTAPPGHFMITKRTWAEPEYGHPDSKSSTRIIPPVPVLLVVCTGHLFICLPGLNYRLDLFSKILTVIIKFFASFERYKYTFLIENPKLTVRRNEISDVPYYC